MEVIRRRPGEPLPMPRAPAWPTTQLNYYAYVPEMIVYYLDGSRIIERRCGHPTSARGLKTGPYVLAPPQEIWWSIPSVGSGLA